MEQLFKIKEIISNIFSSNIEEIKKLPFIGGNIKELNKLVFFVMLFYNFVSVLFS